MSLKIPPCSIFIPHVQSDPSPLFLTLILSLLSALFLPDLTSCLDVFSVLLGALSNSLTPTPLLSPLLSEGLSTTLDELDFAHHGTSTGDSSEIPCHFWR